MPVPSHETKLANRPKVVLVLALVAVIATLSVSLIPAFAEAGGRRDHPRRTDGTPKMVCSPACRVTYMKWVARLAADPSTSAGVHIAGLVGGDVGRGWYVGLVIGNDNTSMPGLWLGTRMISGWGR